MILTAALAQPVLAATKAGRVVFATGQPLAVNAAGTQRNLQRGDDVFAGDTLKTSSNGRLQVSFIDGAFVSVQPASEYKIDEYRFDGKQDGTESSVASLIKGGIRAVTGLIGKEHHDAYKLHTSAATIGIRGTGFNTRICQGDCPGKANGLYHSTWEGITYVFNNVDSVTIPSGRGVYVRNMNTPIEFLSQPPVVTAVQVGEKQQQEQKQDEDQSNVIAAGNQKTGAGLPTVIIGNNNVIPTASKTLLNQNFVAVAPPGADQQVPVDMVAGTQATVFVGDSGYVGILSTQHDQNSSQMQRSIGTVDIAAVLGGDDAASVQEVETLLQGADQTTVEQFLADPAHIAESTINPVGIGWGRWANGQVLIMDDSGHTEARQLTGNQSVHFVFGPEPPMIPTTGTATYGFLGGTQSTSLSGATIGDGVIGGIIDVYFGDAYAFLGMGVSHAGNLYDISGPLSVAPAGQNQISDIPEAVTAQIYSRTGFVLNGPCGGYPGCITHIQGRFAGPMDDNSNPANLGITYTIDTQDPITGAAAFSTAVSPQDAMGQLPPVLTDGPIGYTGL